MRFKKIIASCLAILMLPAFSFIFAACSSEEDAKYLDPDKITLIGTTATYDGNAHIFDVYYGGKQMKTVRYSKDDGNTYQAAIDLNLVGDPTKDTTYYIKYKFTIDGFEEYNGETEMKIVLGEVLKTDVNIRNADDIDSVVDTVTLYYTGSNQLFEVLYKGNVVSDVKFSEKETGPYVSNFTGYKGDPTKDFSKMVYYKFKIDGFKEFYGSVELKIIQVGIDTDKLTLNGTTTEYNGTSQIFSIEYDGYDVTNVEYSLDDKNYTSDFKECVNATSYEVNYRFKLSGFAMYYGKQTFTIEQKLLDSNKISIYDENCVYVGEALTPEILFSDPLVTSSDYEATYVNNTNAGTANLIIKGVNNFTGTIEKTFTIKPKALTTDNVTFNANAVYNGTDLKNSIDNNLLVKDTVVLGNNDYTHYYTKDGLEITEMKNAGLYYVIIQGKGNYTGTIQKPFRIEQYTISLLKDVRLGDFKNINGIPEFVECSKYVYTGAQITPTVQIENVSTSDFTATKYSNNIDAGTASVIISLTNSNYKFDGNVTETKKEFTIEPQTLLPANVDISLTEQGTTTIVEYNGEAYQFARFNVEGTQGTAETKLKSPGYYTDEESGEEVYYKGDYKITIYKDNLQTTELKNAGEYFVKIEGINNFTGEIEEKFTITPMELTAEMFNSVEISGENTYDGSYKGVAVEKSESAPTFLTDNDYEIVIYMDRFTNTFNSVDYVRDAGNYKVCVKGKNNFKVNEELKLEEFTINRKEIPNTDITLAGKNLTEEIKIAYVNGVSQYTPGAAINGISTSLYSVRYENNNSSGIATAIINLDSTNYKFEDEKLSKELKFQIGENLEEVDSISVGDSVYNALVRNVIVTFDKNALTKDADYNIEIKNSNGEISEIKNADTYSLIITGVNGFFGTYTKNITIEKRQITDDDVSLVTSEVYKGTAINPDLTVKSGDIDLVEGENADYKVIYKQNEQQVHDMINAGEYKIVVMANDKNFTGTIEKPFTIERYTIFSSPNDNIFLSKYSFEYTGKELKPDVSILLNGQTLSAELYEVTYENCINACVDYESDLAPTVIVTLKEIDGIRNFEFRDGSITFSRTYAISQRALSRSNLRIANNNVSYTGSAIVPIIVDNIDGEDRIINYTNDCSISYKQGSTSIEGMVDANTYSVKLTGTNNYYSELDFEFTIERFIIEDSTIYFDGVHYSEYSPVYNGRKHEPTVTIGTEGEADYVPSEMFQIIYTESNINVLDSSYVVIDISRSGNYSFETGGLLKQIEFNILPAQLPDVFSLVLSWDYEVDGDGNVIYTGQEIVPMIGSDGGVSYDMECEDNVNVGTAKVIFTGKYNYTGEVIKTFQIVPRTLTSSMLSFSLDNQYSYDGKVRELITTNNQGDTLTENDYDIAIYFQEFNSSDYELVQEIKNAGNYKIVATAKNNYTGEISWSTGITKHQLTIYGDNLTVFKGTPKDEININYWNVGVAEGETIDYNLVVDYTEDTDYGTYPIVIEGGIEQLEDNYPNYHISYAGLNLTVIGLLKNTAQNKQYMDIQEAIDSANENDIIMLNADVVVDETIYINKSVSFNGNYDYSIKASDNFIGSNLIEITDGDVDFENIELNANHKARAIKVSSGELTLQNVSVLNGYSSSYAGGVFVTGTATVSINNSTITGNSYAGMEEDLLNINETNYYKVYSSDLWIGSQVNGAIYNDSIIGNVFVDADGNGSEYFVQVHASTIETIYLDYDQDYDYGVGVEITDTEIVNHLLVSTTTTGEWVEIDLEYAGFGIYEGDANNYASNIIQSCIAAYAVADNQMVIFEYFSDVLQFMDDYAMNFREISSLTIINSTIDVLTFMEVYENFREISSLTFINATIIGTIDINNENVEFINCEFIAIMDDYSVVLGANVNEVTFKNCIISGSYGILVASRHSVMTINLQNNIFEDCWLSDTSGESIYFIASEDGGDEFTIVDLGGNEII